MWLTWIWFLISLTVVLVVSRKNLALALISGALLLGVLTLPLDLVMDRVIYTLTEPSILLLSAAMAIIPLLGGTMKESGQVDSLVNNVHLSQRYLLPFSSALMGLLPMPGGALLSAPILEAGGKGVDNGLKAVINNWFRHLFILVYPLGPALIVSAEISNIDVYVAIVYLLPGALVALILGQVFYLRHVPKIRAFTGPFSTFGLLIPLVIILSAPILDFLLKRLCGLGNLATLIGVSTGLTLSVVLSKNKLHLWQITRRMRPWNFGLIIIGMFLYLHIFQESDARNLIAMLPLPILTLSVTAGFVLGLVTGRVQLPASIVIPVYLAVVDQVTPFVFALIYLAIYFGYIISPVHPCLVVTCEYFHITIREIMARLFWPTIIVIGLVVGLSIIAG